MRQVTVIGGGASGMFAAITAANSGALVTILEHKNRLGKKILSTGNGKCNYTNTVLDASHYYNNKFAMEVIRQFNVEKTLEYFKTLGIWPKIKNGYCYPASEQASAILEVLQQEVERQKIVVKTEAEILSIKEVKNQFRIQLKESNVKADAIILACGGCAAANTGSDGSGYALAKSFGHGIHKPVPALTGFICEEKFFKQLAGIRTQARLKLLIGNEVFEEEGEVQLAAYGVSGIPTFQLCRYGARQKKCSLEIDFMPSLKEEELVTYLQTHETSQYIGMFNKKLLDVFIKRYGESPKKLAKGIKHFAVTVIGTSDFSKAQVTSGGVYCEEIDSTTMQSKFVPNLYFAGEIVDVDGKCGGYNLQWAWSSGYVAGLAAGKGEKRR
jgi:hypothetical protein